MVNTNHLNLPGNYIFAFLSSHYGIIAAASVILLVLIICILAFCLASVQKNQLGMMVGYGCGLVLLTMTLLSLAAGTGLVVNTQNLLPFISYGGSNLMVSYALLGLVLSIYRYKNLLPPERKKILGNHAVQ